LPAGYSTIETIGGVSGMKSTPELAPEHYELIENV
jgi:hypothetical protein